MRWRPDRNEVFADRRDAGRQLAAELGHLAGPDVVVLGLPRGGVPVAAEVAGALAAPLDVILVRKLGVPAHPELAMGALGEGGVRVLDAEVCRRARVQPDQLRVVEERERAELERRAVRYREGRPRVDLRGRVALVVDDGVATGSTARAACEVARRAGARAVVLAAPVGPPSAPSDLSPAADEVVILRVPPHLDAVGRWYRDFTPTTDDEVVELLRPAGGGTGGRA